MDTINTIFARTSYRGKYESTPGPREHLQLLLEAGLSAPSGCNKQTTSLVAIDDPALLKPLVALTQKHIGDTAPAMILVLAQKAIA